MKIPTGIQERYLYTMALLIHLVPVILLSPFVTLDGPAHLYNACIIKTMMAGGNIVINQFFEFNTFPHPNWSGHMILVALTGIFPPLLAEKVFLMMIILISAIGFRRLVLKIEPSAVWMSWLYFPFIMSFPFLLGFYNFSLALALLPWWLSLWIDHHLKPKSWKFTLTVFIFLWVMYFSHLVVFLLAGLFAGIISILDRQYQDKKLLLKELLFLFLCSSPGLILTTAFLMISGTEGYRGEISRLPVQQLLSDLLYSRMFITYDYITERRVTLGFTVLMLFLTSTGIIHRTIQKLQKTFLVILLISLCLIFVLPDSMASGGILSVRLVQWFFIVWCLWLVTLRIPVKYQIISAICAAIFSIGMLKIHWKVQVELCRDANEYISISKNISDNKLLLPLNYSSNWMHSNMACYLGVLRKITVLDNYEATHDLFPLLWRKGMNPEIHLGNHVSSTHPCVRISSSEKYTGLKIDYISLWHSNEESSDSCDMDVWKQVQNGYVLVNDNGETNIKLYKKKQP